MDKEKRPLSIEVKLTDRCNQECVHCVNRDGLGSEGSLDHKLFIRRLEEWARERDRSSVILREIRMTGGEPLLAYEAVLGIADCCRRLGIRSGINTNGLLLSPERLRGLKAGGLEVLKVSFDGMNRNVYSRDPGFTFSSPGLSDAVKLSVRLGFKVILRFTLSRRNTDQLLPCWQFAQDLDVYKFQIKPLVRAGRALDLDWSLSQREVEEALRRLWERSAGTILPVEILCWPPGDGLGFAYKVCGNIHKIYVSASLGVSICNYIQDGLHLPLGDLRRSPLETVFRRRLRERWSESINNHRLVKGCPNSSLFQSFQGR